MNRIHREIDLAAKSGPLASPAGESVLRRILEHPALAGLLEWHEHRGATPDIRKAAQQASTLFRQWLDTHTDQKPQLAFFEER